MTFPKQAQSVLNIFEVFNLNITELSLPFSCIGLGSYWQHMFITMIVPFVIATCIVLTSLAYVSYEQHQRQLGGNSVVRDNFKSLIKQCGLLALPYLLILSFLVFPMVSTTAFRAFPCEKFDNGRSFLRADYAVECGTPEHNDVVVLAWIGVALYSIGITFLYTVLFYKARRAILDDKPTLISRALGFLALDF